MADLKSPTLTADEIDELVHAAYSAFMAGYSYNSSMGKAAEIYADAPELHNNYDRSVFMAVMARAIRGWYNIRFVERDEVVQYVYQAYGER